MTVPVTLTVNGQRQTHEVEPRLLLVHYLRNVLGLTGTKVASMASRSSRAPASPRRPMAPR
jgi:carbon-monoxide dehydrogenase small subunit